MRKTSCKDVHSDEAWLRVKIHEAVCDTACSKRLHSNIWCKKHAHLLIWNTLNTPNCSYLGRRHRLYRRCWTGTCWRPLAASWHWLSRWPAIPCRRTRAAAPARRHWCCSCLAPAPPHSSSPLSTWSRQREEVRDAPRGKARKQKQKDKKGIGTQIRVCYTRHP